MKQFLTLVLVGIGFFGSAASRAEAPASDVVTHEATVAADGVQHVQIEGGSYFFKPNRVIVRVNVPVVLSVKVDSGVVPHSLVIQAPEAGITVDEGLSSDAKTIRFTPTAVGRYPFHCSNRLLFFQSHREKGMEGVLEVVD